MQPTFRPLALGPAARACEDTSYGTSWARNQQARQARRHRMLDMLGLDPRAEPWAQQVGAGDEYRDALGVLVDVTLEQRQLAGARKDYATPTR
ncbi:hypothetical protein ACL02O_33640 [Micromonospora sp. MS34]|uniref:hypothetical protein n=1 Tax=Micromonospora sp. MS34 TaxID=3385971 RepID=UPI0039A13315